MPNSNAKPTAIVIDDSVTARKQLIMMLTAVGIEVVAEGGSGDQAIVLYERHRPSIVTLDIVLPIMDGISAARLLLSKFPQAQVMMCSSIAARDKIMACVNAGVAHFVLKPFDAAKIASVVAALLAKGTSMAQQPKCEAVA